jgi:DNA-binding response OmpR family regulator
MSGRQVLAIDDQTEILDVIRLAIELTTDWTLHTATSASAALVTSGRGTGNSQYDVVLLDLTIPGEDPYVTVKDLRAHAVSQSVVLLTGAPVTDIERRSIGADAMIAKPFDPMSLAADVSRALGWVAP